MKFARIGQPGHEIPAVSFDDGPGRWFSVSSITADIDGTFLSTDGIERTRQEFQVGNLPPIDGSTIHRFGSPIARPGAVIGIGMNYEAHLEEAGAAKSPTPTVFMKPSNTVTGPFDDGPLPHNSDMYDWEVELGVVIGQSTFALSSPADASSRIAGYVLANDLSERNFQFNGGGGQWTKGKSVPGSTSLGPWFVPATYLDPTNISLQTWVNADPRQSSTTADMVFDVPTLVHHLSHHMQLEPGDVILTGTPQGVAMSGRFPYIGQGDVVEVQAEGLGRQRRTFYVATAH